MKEVIPIQDLFEMALNYPVDAIRKEDSAASRISANKGYSPAVRGLKRTQRVSTGYIHDVISAPAEPGRGTIAVEKQATATHRGDIFNRSLDPGKYSSALKMIGVIPYADRPSRTKPPAAVKTDRSKLIESKMDKDKMNKNKMVENDVEEGRARHRLQQRQLPELPPQRGELFLLNGPLDVGPLGERGRRRDAVGFLFTLKRTGFYHARGECGLVSFPVWFDTNRRIYGFCTGVKQNPPSSVFREYLGLCSGLGIRPCSSHRAEDFAGRNPCLPDSRTAPMFRLQTLRRLACQNRSERTNPQREFLPGFYFGSRPLTDSGASPKRQYT